MQAVEDQGVMRSTDQRRRDYFTPDVPPTSPEELPQWLEIQLQNLQSAMFNINSLHLERMYKFPERFKPREGDIILAQQDIDDPEITKDGLYYYSGSEWIFIA